MSISWSLIHGSAHQSEPATFTILLYSPRINRVGAHWPTKLLCSFFPMICSAKEPAMEP
jgi:hypothetical protein